VQACEIDAWIGGQLRLRLTFDLAAVPRVDVQVATGLHHELLQWHDFCTQRFGGALRQLQGKRVLAVAISLHAVSMELFDAEFTWFGLLGQHDKVVFNYENSITM